MPEPRIKILTEQDALERIVYTVQQAEPGEAPFALVLGAGFSQGLVPTARELVKESLPLWARARATGEAFDALKKLPAAERLGIARQFWAEFARLNPKCQPAVALDSITGLPVDHTVAYMAAFDPACNGAVGSPADARKFQRALMRLDQPRLNAAHFLLTSVLGVQPRRSRPGPSAWFKTRAAFCRLILTTNFDPFLQIALQLASRLYFMSDTPDLGVSDEILDDHTDAIHLVYLHGSIHRRLQAADEGCIRQIKERNARTLASCLKRRGVIVLGYSGWDDAIVEALAQCDTFDHRLYWCGLEPDPLARGAFGQRVPEVLRKPTAQYVRIDGAGRFMAGLLTALTGKLPRLLDDPIGQLRDLLEMIDLKELETPRAAATDVLAAGQLFPSGISDEAFVAARQSALERLPLAQQAFEGQIQAVQADETLVLKQPGPGQAETQTRAASAGSSPDSGTKVRQLLVSAQLARSMSNYAEAKRICDEVLTVAGLDASEKAEAWNIRGYAECFTGRMDDAIADWSRVIELPDAPVGQVAKALVNRGVTWGRKGETDKALADYTRLIEQMPDAPVGQMAWALYNRGVTWSRKGETDKELADYTHLIDQMSDAPVEQVGRALVNRGIAWSRKGETEKELADYTRVIEQMPDAPVGQMAWALYNRGVMWGQKGETDKALADYTRLIEQMPDAPVEQVARALANRGWARHKNGDPCGFLADTEAALAKDPSLDVAAFNLGLALLACRRDTDALDAYRRAGQQFPDKIDSLALPDLAGACGKWLSEERAGPIVEMLESLKQGEGASAESG